MKMGTKIKGNQGENPTHDAFFPKDQVSNLNFFLYPEISAGNLKEKLAKYTGFAPDNIFCTNGSDEALFLLIRLFTKPGDEIIVCPPTFFKYDFYAKFSHASAISIVRNSDFSLNLDKISSSISPKTKMIIVDSPGNPCGETINRTQLEILLKKGITVVIDECYFEYCQETVIDLIQKYPNLVVVRSFSKWAGMAGLRVGYIIANEAVISGLIEIRFPLYVNTVGQYFASFVLDNKDSFLKRVADLVKIRDMAIKRLKKYLDLTVYSSKTPFVVFKLNKLGSALDLQKFLEQKNILVYVMNQPLNEPLLENSIRVNLSTEEEVEYFCSSFKGWVTIQQGKIKQL